MTDIVFLTVDDVLKLHQHQIDVYGGEHGVRDFGLLESALAMPQSMFGGQYLHQDIYEMASACLFHLVKNHPFIDGNKRAGAVAAYVFWQSTASNSPHRQMILPKWCLRLPKADSINKKLPTSFDNIRSQSHDQTGLLRSARREQDGVG